MERLRLTAFVLSTGLFSASSVMAAAPKTAKDALEATDFGALETLLAKEKDKDEANLLRGRAALMRGKFDEAEKATTLVKKKAGGAFLLAQVKSARGDVKGAIALLEPIKEDPAARQARLLLGELLLQSGKRADAKPLLLKFAEEYSDDTIKNTDAAGLSMVARAMHLLHSIKDANRAFNESERAEKGRNETLLWRAELFLENYDTGHAEEVLHELLQHAPFHADGIVMLARVKLEQTLDFEEARKLANKALLINPNHTGARAILAGLSLRDMNMGAAEAELAKGFLVNPNDLELWSLKAAVRFLADDRTGYESAKREALSRNGEYSAFFRIVGEYAEWEHRYDDIVSMMKEATAIDPNDGKAWSTLGLMLMRGGDEKSGKEALEESWKHDRYNVRAFNTLERLYKDWIPTGYVDTESSIFRIRYPKDKKSIFERYISRFAERAWSTMKARYGFVPATPVQLELYAERQHFSVRTSGLPNIGIQGVCFGRVVAAMSPESEPFNWGNVIWHELGHVFAIQMSKNHVPRWFTEGLSEYETIAVKPEWGRELDPELYSALVRDVLPPVIDMNQAFTHASSGLDVSVAYYAASQMLVFIADRFGMKAIAVALRTWGEGLSTAQVMERAFSTKPTQFDSEFRTWLKSRLSRYEKQYVFLRKVKDLGEASKTARARPNDVDALVDFALSLASNKKAEKAAETIEQALRLKPDHRDAHFIAYRLARAQRDTKGARQHLDILQKGGADGYDIALGYAWLASAAKNDAGLKAGLEKAHAWDPTQAAPLRELLNVYERTKDETAVLSTLRKLVLLEQHDLRLHKALLERLVKAQQWAEATRVAEASLYISLDDRALHETYATALEHIGDKGRAKYERESAEASREPPKTTVHPEE